MSTELDAVIVEPEATHKASVIWLHGLGADGHDFEPIVPELGLAKEAGIRFIFPHAPVRAITINGGLSMRAWYDIKQIDLTRQEDADSIKDSTNILRRYIARENEAGIATEKIIIAGFSQGGAIALYSGLRHSEKLAGILALSTYMPLLDTLADDINAANKDTAILQIHGSYDPVIPITTAKQSYEQLEQLGCNISWQDYPMQHAVCPPEISLIGDWLKQRLLD